MSFSSLYVSGKYASHTKHQIFQAIKPLIDFSPLLQSATVAIMKENIRRRAGCRLLTVTSEDVDSIGHPLKALVSLKTEIGSLKEKRNSLRERLVAENVSDKSEIAPITEKIQALQSQVFDLEDVVVPIILNLPNSISDSVPDTDEIFRESNTDLVHRVRPFKQLDYRQLSYINEAVFSSPVGPESQYEAGIMARLRYSIMDRFCENVRRSGFIDFSGMDFSKSAVVEAVRVKADRDYSSDVYRIEHGYDAAAESQQLHLSGESSLESFCAYACRIARKPVRNMRFFASGTEYQKDSNGPVQSQTVRTFSLLDKEEDVEHEVQNLTDMTWNMYPKLSVPVRGVVAAASSLMPNESYRFDIQVYHPKAKTWKRVAYVSNYSDFMPRRLGIDNKQLVSAVVVDSRILTQAIVEINQTDKGTFTIPDGLDMFT